MGAGKRILVIDDNPDILDVLQSLLMSEFAVDTALSGEAALGMVKTEGYYQAILCDLMMPGMTGMELYSKIIAKFPGMEPRIIFMTGGSPSSLVGDFLVGRQNRVIEKPFEIAPLRQLLSTIAK